MKKILSFIVLIFTLHVSYSFSTSYLRVIQSVYPLSAANISDSGQRMVFVGTYSKTQEGIFLSEAPLWQDVHAIVVTGQSLPGTKLKLKSFLNTVTQDSFTDFNGPTISDSTVAFAAMTTTHKFGLFYAEPGKPTWLTHKIVLVGDEFQSGIKFTVLNAPYTFEKHHILFLATLSNQQTGVFSYDIQTKHLYQITEGQDTKPPLNNFSDMSVNQYDFAIRANEGNSMSVFLYNGSDDFNRLSSLYGQDSKMPTVIGRPSYFQVGEKANVIFPVATQPVNGVYEHYSLVGNMSNDNHPLVSTGETVPNGQDTFDVLSNPSLMYAQDHFYFTFEATTQKLPNTSGVYLVKLDHGNVHMISLVDPSVPFDGGRVINAKLGSISIRNNNIPVSVEFKSGYYGIYLFQMKE